MESNRDEAERCIQIAAQALRESKMEKAEKFLKKAEQLYPSQKAKGNFQNQSAPYPPQVGHLLNGIIISFIKKCMIL